MKQFKLAAFRQCVANSVRLSWFAFISSLDLLALLAWTKYFPTAP